MSDVLAVSGAAPKPEHVPADRVFDYDVWTDARLRDDIQLGMMSLHDDAPDIFWTPRNGGHWMVTRIRDARQVVTDTTTFSSVDAYLEPTRAGGVIKLPPQDMDPPEHMQHRKLLLQFLAPKDMRRQEANIRALVNDLIDQLEGRNSCDFKEEIAVPLPVSIFMKIMQWDLSRLREFVGWVHAIIGSNVPERRFTAFGELMGFLTQAIEEKSQNPGDDPISLLLASEVDGTPLTKERVREMATLLFVAGLDTVTNAMTFMMQHLAQHPELQQRLRDNPDQLDVAVEELLRRFSFVNTQRRVTTDTVFEGVTMKAEDIVVVSLCAASNDDREFKCPAQVNLDRGRPAHVTFNTGPHACAGAPLARIEIRILLEEWLRRMPDVRLAPGFKQVTRGGSVMTIERLDIVW